MINALNLNKNLSIIVVAVVTGIIILIMTDYYAYIIPFILITALLAMFLEKIKNNFYMLIWSGLFLSPFLGGVRELEDILHQTVNPIRIIRIIIISFVFFMVIINMMLKNYERSGAILKSPLGWFLLYSIVGMASSVYSDHFFVSLWKGFEVFVYVITSIYIVQNLKKLQDLQRFWSLNITFIFILIVSSYIGVFISPSEAFTEMHRVSFKVLRGVYPFINPNSLTQMCAIVIVIFLIRFVYDKNKYWSLFIVLFVFPALILSYGRTSILALFFAMMIFFVLTKKNRYLYLLGVIILFVFIIDGVSYIKLFMEKGDSFSTLSGRLTNWPEAWALFKKSPIYGYGFYVASRIIFSQRVKVESFSTTDNTYYDVLLSVGIIGFIPFALMIYSFIKNLTKNMDATRYSEITRLKHEILAVTIIILFRSLTGPSIQILHWNLSLFLTLIICLQRLNDFKNSLES